MLWLVLLLIAESESVLLQPNSTSTCPGSVVSLECSGAEGLLGWVAVRDEQVLWRMNYRATDDPGTIRRSEMSSIATGESVLLSRDRYSSTMGFVYISVLNVTVSIEDLSVRCEAATVRTTATIYVFTSKYVLLPTE